MFRRRSKGEDTPVAPSTQEAQAAQEGGPGDADTSPSPEPAASDAPAVPGQIKPARPNGPWDVDEMDDRPAHVAPRLNLGAVRIRPPAGMKVSIQVDKSTQTATNVTLVGDHGALQLLVVAAAKSRPQWPTLMRALQSDADRRGGTVQEGKGPWGPVLRMTIPAELPDGSKGVQPSVVLGIDGPRWMLRATVIGKASMDQEQMNRMMAIVQDTVVVRGEEPMAPGEIVPMVPPPRPDSEDPESAAGPADGSVDTTSEDAPQDDAVQDERPTPAE